MESKEILVHVQSISDCGNVLKYIKSQQLLITVINTSNQPQTINIPKLDKLTYEIIKEASIKHISKINQVITNLSSRIKKINEALRTDHMSTEE